jgi:hypothetical protein
MGYSGHGGEHKGPNEAEHFDKTSDYELSK